jgi:membrane protease YdiL (CAAX protease family)
MAATATVPRVWTPSASTSVAVCLAGGALLLLRPWLTATVDDATPVLVAIFVTIGVTSMWWPVGGETHADARTAALITSAGVLAFAVGRVLMGGRAAAPATVAFVVLNTVAAVAEEALFRRLLYAVLSRWGAVAAIVGSASAFAVVHLTVWGVWALPLDLAAGLLLSWQRWATGRWTVPALTHAAANVLAVLG